jgi:hypothetical protein
MDEVNAIYDTARFSLLTAQLNWMTVQVTLSAWAGTPDFDPTDETLADIKARGGVELAASLPVLGNTVSLDGTAQTGPIVIPTVPIGADVTWFTLARVNATHDLSPLLLFVDEATDLPFEPNGLDMLVMPDWALNRGWFRP